MRKNDTNDSVCLHKICVFLTHQVHKCWMTSEMFPGIYLKAKVYYSKMYVNLKIPFEYCCLFPLLCHL